MKGVVLPALRAVWAPLEAHVAPAPGHRQENEAPSLMPLEPSSTSYFPVLCLLLQEDLAHTLKGCFQLQLWTAWYQGVKLRLFPALSGSFDCLIRR